jgi:hypothetical protein
LAAQGGADAGPSSVQPPQQSKPAPKMTPAAATAAAAMTDGSGRVRPELVDLKQNAPDHMMQQIRKRLRFSRASAQVRG